MRFYKVGYKGDVYVFLSLKPAFEFMTALSPGIFTFKITGKF